MSCNLNSCPCKAPSIAKSIFSFLARRVAASTSLAAIASSSSAIVFFIDRRVKSLASCSFCWSVALTPSLFISSCLASSAACTCILSRSNISSPLPRARAAASSANWSFFSLVIFLSSSNFFLLASASALDILSKVARLFSSLAYASAAFLRALFVLSCISAAVPVIGSKPTSASKPFNNNFKNGFFFSSSILASNFSKLVTALPKALPICVPKSIIIVWNSSTLTPLSSRLSIKPSPIFSLARSAAWPILASLPA